MADPICFASRQICRVRIALLTQAGAPVQGSNNGYVTDSMVSLELSPEVAEGDEFEAKNGCGDVCQTFRDCDQVKRVGLTMSICTNDAQFLELLMGGTAFVDSGDVIGHKAAKLGDGCVPPVSLEWWTYAHDGSQQATPAALGGSPGFWHFVIPLTRWRFGDLTFENDLTMVEAEGFGEENSSITSNGPFDDWPAEVADTGGADSWYNNWIEDSLPDANCDYLAVTSAAS